MSSPVGGNREADWMSMAANASSTVAERRAIGDGNLIAQEVDLAMRSKKNIGRQCAG